MARGLLTSQIGHDLGERVRAIYRAPEADALPADARLRVLAADGSERASIALAPWGACWGARWWTADAGELPAGTWGLALVAGGRELERALVDVAPQRLWRATWREVALEQLERRTKIASVKHGTGWQDAGCDWQEANSHAACIVGLADLILVAGVAGDDRARVVEQIRGGCRLLDHMQDEAAKLGLPPGSLIHEPRRARHPLNRDAAWAALAWARAAQALGGDEAAAWRARAAAALRWWAQAPVDNAKMDPVAHGWKPGYAAPAETPTVDVGLAAWAHAELASAPDDASGCEARRLAQRLIGLQIAPQAGAPHGNFWEFADRAHPAPVWTHNMIGPDTGETGIGPAWALSRLLARWGDHAEAPRWRAALVAHATGWLLPQAQASPFAIAARVWSGGWVHFGGLWHGMNAVYGHQAALCDDLAGLLGMPELRHLATANRQWIAGLNAGLTGEAIALGCEMSRPAVEPGRALPAAMIQGVGRRWVGGWMAIPGAIPNGFAVGKQFRCDVPADPAQDGPTSFTDEDWITHAGGWLMAVARVAE